MGSGSEERGAARAPDWLHDALRSAAAELRLFVETLWAVTVRPESFARAWASHTVRAANPLAFLATCASVLAAVMQVLQTLGFRLTGENVTFSEQLLNTTGPFLQYAVVGAVAHVLLLPVRPRRRFLDSLAMGLYAGGPALSGYALVMAVMTIVWFRLGSPPLTNGLATMPSVWGHRLFMSLWLVVFLFARSLWLGLAGLRGGRRVACGVITVVAIALLGLVLGKLDVHGPYGMQLVIVVDHGRPHWGLHD